MLSTNSLHFFKLTSNFLSPKNTRTRCTHFFSWWSSVVKWRSDRFSHSLRFFISSYCLRPVVKRIFVLRGFLNFFVHAMKAKLRWTRRVTKRQYFENRSRATTGKKVKCWGYDEKLINLWGQFRVLTVVEAAPGRVLSIADFIITIPMLLVLQGKISTNWHS